ncbi:sugar porter family MFS transporter [Granulicoccus phenolivorans]|uniref:sugar porter family MFS transporter n=1 Tax=Granulicoccus phenolivorans TaxID=266854 RepID=UPI0004138026|nr:sugar porter family MFS transporter [Granulicoccus phenolivorans]
MTETSAPARISVVRIAAAAAMGGLLFGYDSAVINGAVSGINQQLTGNAAVLGFAVAAALLGAAVGAFFGGRIADRTGRLPVMRVAALLFLISAIGAGLSYHVAVLVVFRVIGGIGVGVASVIAPAYIAEVAPARIRGRLGSMQQLAIVLGIFLSLLVDALLARLAGGSVQPLWWGLEAWRWMFLVMAIPAIVYGISAFTIPESPRFLVAQGRTDEARAILAGVDPSADVDGQLARIQESVRSETKPSLRDLRGPVMGLLPVVWVGLAIAVLQQFVGINVIFYYSNVLWESVGFSESDSFTISVATSIVNVAVTVVAIALIDRVGRKPLLLVGSAGMAVTLGTLAVIFGTASKVLVNGELTPQLTGAAGPIALVAANLFVVFFGVSWGPVMWVMLGEMFPNRIRGAALALAGAAQWIANWLVTVTFPPLKEFNLGVAYGAYAVFAIISFIVVAKVVRETRGVELEDMVDGSTR